MAVYKMRTEKTKLAIEKTEVKIKTLDKKIEILKNEVYDNVSSLKALQKRNQKLTEFLKNADFDTVDLCALPELFSFQKDKLIPNNYLAKIVEVLKDEVYTKPTVIADEEFMHLSAQMQYSIDFINTTNFKHKDGSKVDLGKINGACKTLTYKIDQYIDQGIGNISEYFHLKVLHEKFVKETGNLMNELRLLIKNMKEFTIMDIDKVRNHLYCLKTQVDVVLKSKWKFQKCLLSLDCSAEEILNLYDETNFLSSNDCSKLILENVEDTLFYLRILDGMESNKHFCVMSSLCELQERRELLTNKFRNFVTRIGHQKMRHTPTTKSILLKLNQEIQVLIGDYQKLRLQFQFLDADKRKELRQSFKDIEATVMANVKKIKDKKSVGHPKFKALSEIESEVAQKKTKDSIKDIMKTVDETAGFLQFLDETFISKEFAVMRYLCELHHSKEQVLSSFKNLLDCMFKLSIEDEEQILNRLKLIKFAAGDLIQKYETVGMQMMLFSDIMTMLNKELEISKSEKSLLNEGKIKISELFQSSEGFEKMNYCIKDVSKFKWFPSKGNLLNMLKDKEQVIGDFQNLADKMLNLGPHNTLDAMHSIVQLIIKAENVLRKYQRLRMQLICMTGSDLLDIKN